MFCVLLFFSLFYALCFLFEVTDWPRCYRKMLREYATGDNIENAEKFRQRHAKAIGPIDWRLINRGSRKY